jgi:hypothetical protein
MRGNVNHRGWIVLESISSDDSQLCVDFFQDPAGGFGFEHFRADPEDRGRWTVVGGFAGSRYPTALAAASAAREAIGWLRLHPNATAALNVWTTSIDQ